MTRQDVLPPVRLRVAPESVVLSIGGDVMNLSAPVTAPAPTSSQSGDAVRDIRSAEIDRLAGEASKALRRLLLSAEEIRQQYEQEAALAQHHAAKAQAAFARWDRGFLWKRIRPAHFLKLSASATEAAKRLDVLLQNRARAVLVSQIEVRPEIRKAFERLQSSFRALAQAKKIWDTLSEQRTNQFAERTAATHAVVRREVKFGEARHQIIFRNCTVPRFANANGGDLYLYPGCVIYSASQGAFALIDTRDIQLKVRPVRFHESATPPEDAKQLGHTWLKVNKDGSPDRRFAGNRPIAIMEYGELTLTTPSGVNEEYLVSDYEAAAAFGAAWADYQKVFMKKD